MGGRVRRGGRVVAIITILPPPHYLKIVINRINKSLFLEYNIFM